MTIGSYTIIKNEVRFIAEHLKSWTPFLQEMVFYDGNSTDGTLDILKSDKSGKVRVFENKDPKDLTDDYQRIFNDCMWELGTDLAIFLHPDMFCIKYSAPKEGIIAATTDIRSFAGDPGGVLYEIKGRGEKWKHIYRLRNPDLGAHYFGAYGAQNEDTYFSEITGSEHRYHGQNFSAYPYPVSESGISIAHFSDVRPLERRIDRMIKTLINQGYKYEVAKGIAEAHPRVTLKDGAGFAFSKVEDTGILKFLGLEGNR